MKVLFFFLYFFFLSLYNNLYPENLPIIVIAPSKKIQSISTVGSSVQVFDEKYLSETNEIFLGDLLYKNTTSINFFQNGGPGQTSGVQLRGLPKRYSTVFIDGIKMSDPSNVSNDFDFNHILLNQISRVEILKGNQSTVYGSGAIGGTINIFTKKANSNDLKKELSYTSGTNKTHNLSYSISQKIKNNSFFVGVERYQTQGISAMTHNDEDDGYKNNTFYGNYNHTYTNKIDLNTNLRIVDAYSQYDAEINSAGLTHSEEAKTIQTTSGISLTYKPNSKLTNELSLSNNLSRRNYNPGNGKSYNTVKDKYFGQNYSLSYLGNYNFNLDNSLTFGLEKNYDKMTYNENFLGEKSKMSEIESINFDYQKRVNKNLFYTFGSRIEGHSIAGNEESHRVTFAYLFDDKTTKIKSSYGTGFRFPSLYELYFIYAANNQSIKNVKAEKSKSFDIGLNKNFSYLNNTELEINYFNLEYYDVLEGWKSGISSGNEYTTENQPGTVKSQGLEIMAKSKINENLNFALNYTYTSTYDGAEQDDPDKNENYFNSQIVRIPRHFLSLITDYDFFSDNKLNLKLSTYWSSKARDYGNGNRTYMDEVIDSYFINDLTIKYKTANNYNISLNVINLFNQSYETAKDYSRPKRSFYLGFKRVY